MPPDSYKSSSFYVENEEVFDEPKKIIWNSERLPNTRSSIAIELPNTHGSRMKILRWTMKEWSKKQNPPMDSIEGRGFMNDEDWVIHMIDEFIPDNGKNSMSDKDKRRANFMFKKYGGSRNGMSFTK